MPLRLKQIVVLVLLFSFLIPLSDAQPNSPNTSVRDLGREIFYSGIHLPIESRLTSLATPPTVPPPDVDYGRVAILSGAFVGSIVATHIYLENGWWKDNRAPFHFQEDLEYGQSVDKAGHFYIAYTLGFLFTETVRWTNVSEESAVWIGGAAGLLLETYVEIEDGFSAWGFDRVDFAADVGGAAWHVGRYYSPFLRNFDVKASYLPSPLLDNPGGIGFKGQKHTIVDDYEGLTLWMSTKVENLVPDAVKPYWPDWLCLAIGYGARDVASAQAYRVLFLAPDLDMTRIIPQTTPFLKALGEGLNHIHFPMPAVQVGPGTIWYGIYF